MGPEGNFNAPSSGCGLFPGRFRPFFPKRDDFFDGLSYNKNNSREGGEIKENGQYNQ